MTSKRTDDQAFDWETAKRRLALSREQALDEQHLSKIFADRARQLALAPHEADVSRGHEHFCFTVRRARLAVALPEVLTVIVPRHVTEIPFAPPHLRKVIYLGGRIVSVVDLGAILRITGFERDVHDGPGQVIVFEHRGYQLGAFVDALLGLARFDPSSLAPTAHGHAHDLLRGIADDMTLVLNVQRLMDGLRPPEPAPPTGR